MSVLIRHLGPDEWQTYRSVRLAALLDTPAAFASTYDDAAAITAQRWRERCTDTSWFAFVDGEPVGMVRLDRQPDSGEPELISMWVAPTARGTSAAADLVAAAVRRVRESGHPRLCLRVVDGNGRARAFYVKAGFVENGVRERLPDGRWESEMTVEFDSRRRVPSG